MKLTRAYTPGELIQIVGGHYIGDHSVRATGINEIHLVHPGDIAFVDHPKYYKNTLSSAAHVIIIDQEVECPVGKALIKHEDPFGAFLALLDHFLAEQEREMSPEPEIHASTTVMPGAHIGNYVRIGKDCIIHPGAVIYDHVIVGDHVEIHANAVIGSDAFYYKRRPVHHRKLRSVGRVVIGDHVDIGAGCTIDRGTTGDTTIGEGTKMDNLVHIGHDTEIGKGCLFAAQVGIAGCVTIGDGVVMWGQSGCAANVVIGDGAVILAQSGIAKSLEGGQSYFGSPAMKAKLKMRELAILSRISRKEG